MMKKMTKILVVAVSLILLLSVLIFGSSAEEAPEASAVDGTPVFEVKYQDGRSEYFYTWKSTLAATEDNCIIKLLEDYEEGVIVDQPASPLNTKGVVLDLNGKTLSSSWTTNSAGEPTWQRTVVQDDGSITVVGNGTIRSASAFFQVTGGTVTINPGEGKTINITAIGGYKYSGDNVTTSTFSGAPFFKIGNNGNANNPNVENSGKACALNIIGNVNYIEDNTGTAVTFIGIYPGAKLNIGDPDANVNTTINATFNSASTVFLEYLWFASATPDKYTVFSENGAFLPAEANISNVDINMPYGSFVKTANYSKVKTFDEAARLNVYKADLNFNGNGTLKQTDFQFNDNAKVFARFTETKIVSDADRVLYANCSTHIPNALTIFKDCYVDTAAYSSSTKQQLFRYSGTVLVEGGYYDVTCDYFYDVGYAWTTP